MILDEYRGRICANADIEPLVRFYPREPAYALALIGCGNQYSVTPPWLLHNFPKTENVIKFLCNTPCKDGCSYCRNALDVHKGLKKFFGFDSFRTYNGEPLQEKAARAAVEGKSLLAVFPTGGGKPITFQLPALMADKAAHSLTVVISPFYDEQEQEAIYVSTIHKCKGREFDNVYMMLKNSAGSTDAERRALYVGMTRARSNLYIHTNTVLFDKYRMNGIEHTADDAVYEEPAEIMFQTTHKDVVLDFFKNKKEIKFTLRSGTRLKIDDVYLTAELNRRDVRVAKFSKAFAETLEKLKGKGYSPEFAEVRFIVAWKGENDEEETPVILADMYFKK